MSATDQWDLHTLTFLLAGYLGFVDCTAMTGDRKRLILGLMMSRLLEPSLEDLHKDVYR